MNTKFYFKFVLVIGVMLSVFACVNIPRVDNPAPYVELGRQAQEHISQPYRIQRSDVLDIKFFHNPELNETALTVRPDGTISLPLIKEVRAIDLTPVELSEQLKEKYSQILAKTDITINIKTYAGQKIYIDGEVMRRAQFSYVAPMTVMDAITQAGGFTEYALHEEVVVIRRPHGQKPKATVVDMRKYLSAVDFTQDINLMPNDIVFVPRTHIGDVNRWVDQYIRNMLPYGPSPTVIYGGSATGSTGY